MRKVILFIALLGLVSSKLTPFQRYEFFADKCKEEFDKCHDDNDCNHFPGCFGQCSQRSYTNNPIQIYECYHSCAKDLKNNTAFQTLAKCENDEFSQANYYPFACFGDCQKEVKNCQADKKCIQSLQCYNTCQGDLECFKDCEDNTKNKYAGAFFECARPCIENSMPFFY